MLIHFVAVLFFPTFPILSYFVLKKMKSDKSLNQIDNAYISIYFVYWCYTFLLFCFYPIHEMFFLKSESNIPGWVAAIVIVLLILGAIKLFGPQLAFNRNKEVRDLILEGFDKESHIFPQTDRQKIMMIFVAITVGITEEIIFRSFYFLYFQDQWNASPIISLLVCSVIFGLAHFHQGSQEVLDSFVFGLLMGLLYMITGSLLWPIILHILYDMKIVTMTHIIQKYKQKERSL